MELFLTGTFSGIFTFKSYKTKTFKLKKNLPLFLFQEWNTNMGFIVRDLLSKSIKLKEGISFSDKKIVE